MRMNAPVARLRRVGVERRAGGATRRLHAADVVELELGGRRLVAVERVDVEARDDLVDDRATVACRVLDRGTRPRAQRPLGHPADIGLELARPVRRGSRAGRSCRRARRRCRPRAAPSPTSGRERLVERAVEASRSPPRSARAADGSTTHLVAGPHDARGDLAGVAAVVGCPSVDRITHWTGKRRSSRLRSSATSTLSRCVQQRRAVVPGHVRPTRSTTLSPCSAVIGMNVDVGRGQLAPERAKSRAISSKRSSVVVDEVHLVDGDDEVRDAEQRRDEARGARLLDARRGARRPARSRRRRSTRR